MRPNKVLKILEILHQTAWVLKTLSQSYDRSLKTKIFHSTLKNALAYYNAGVRSCKFKSLRIDYGSQSYDRELQRQRCKNSQLNEYVA
jgi:hypothetical protein